MSPRSTSSRLRHVDPVGILVTVAALGTLLLRGYDSRLVRDLAVYAYSGQRVADGEAPYVGVLNRAGPLAHLLHGAIVWLARRLGTDDLLTLRVGMTVLSTLTIWILYLVGRDLAGSRAAGAVAAVTLLVFQGFRELATGGPHEKTTMVLLVVIVLWAVLGRRWVLAGVAVALATLTWQPAFVFAAVVAAGALLAQPRRDLVRGLVRFSLGGITTTAVFVLVFWVWGALDDFVQCFLLINLRYTHQATLVSVLANHPQRLVAGYAVDLAVLSVGLLGSLALAVVGGRWAERDAARATRIGVGLGILASIGWALAIAFQSWSDAMVLTPAAALGVGGLFGVLAGSPASGRRRLTPRATTAVATALTLAALTFAWYVSATNRPHQLDEQRRQVAAVLAVAGRDPVIVSVGTPQVLVLGHLTNPNPYQMFVSGFQDYFEATYPGGMAGIARLIESEHPALITVGSINTYPFIQPLLAEQYTRLGGGYRVIWYARTDLGHDAIHRLRQAVRSTR